MTGHKIDVTKGEMRGEVSAQWYTRPDDEKFLNLSSLKAQVAKWRQASFSREFTPAEVRFLTDKDNPQALQVEVGDHGVFDLTNHCFDQLASMASAPAQYLRDLPAALVAANLRYGLLANEDQNAKQAYLMDEGSAPVLRALTSTRYGRIYDEDVVDAVMKLAGEGTGDTHWKVPGMIDWGGAHGVTYNPHVDITKETTTLYASDRDIFLFLVDDTHPIEVGKLADGSPDLMFRGFYVWNSEVGKRTFGVATMYLRGVCQNRNLWGVEGFQEVIFKHTSGAPERFLTEAAPALETYAQGTTSKVVLGVQAAKNAKVVTAKATDPDGQQDDRIDFLAKFGFSKKMAETLIKRGEDEEGHKPNTVWDMSCAITAQARSSDFQEQRLQLEGVAGKMLDRVKA